jgi:hypothetical protein
MQPEPIRWERRSFAWVSLVVWTTAFGLAYAQAPLFTSNQNQYFLHGLARAGYGLLRQDWLANTADPTPVFSLLVEATVRSLPLAFFYVWTFLLFGVYVFSLDGLASDLFHLRDDPVKHRLFLALFVGVHAALARFLLQRALGDAWAYALEGGLAGQRLLGSVIEPSMFGVFLLLSIYLFYRGKPSWSIVCAVGAATVHPTYLLSAALLTLGYALSMLLDSDIRQAIIVPGLALVLVSPILIYTASSFASLAPASLAQAQDILVRQRIPHHTLIQVWWDASAWVQILIVIAGIALLRKTRLFAVAVVCALSALVLSLVQVLSGSQALALLFPWRPSAFLVPLGTTLIVGYAVQRFWGMSRFGMAARGRAHDLVGRASISLVLLLVVAGAVKFQIDRAQKAADPARGVMEFVARTSSSGEVYMIPPYLQDFRLETGTPVLVDFKSIPYRAKEVIEWYDRLLLTRAFYRDQAANVSCRALADAVTRYGVTDVVLAEAQFGASCGPWIERYRDVNFAVYQVVP